MINIINDLFTQIKSWPKFNNFSSSNEVLKLLQDDSYSEILRIEEYLHKLTYKKKVEACIYFLETTFDIQSAIISSFKNISRAELKLISNRLSAFNINYQFSLVLASMAIHQLSIKIKYTDAIMILAKLKEVDLIHKNAELSAVNSSKDIAKFYKIVNSTKLIKYKNKDEMDNSKTSTAYILFSENSNKNLIVVLLASFANGDSIKNLDPIIAQDRFFTLFDKLFIEDKNKIYAFFASKGTVSGNFFLDGKYWDLDNLSVQSKYHFMIEFINHTSEIYMYIDSDEKYSEIMLILSRLEQISNIKSGILFYNHYSKKLEKISLASADYSSFKSIASVLAFSTSTHRVDNIYIKLIYAIQNNLYLKDLDAEFENFYNKISEERSSSRIYRRSKKRLKQYVVRKNENEDTASDRFRYDKNIISTMLSKFYNYEAEEKIISTRWESTDTKDDYLNFYVRLAILNNINAEFLRYDILFKFLLQQTEYNDYVINVLKTKFLKYKKNAKNITERLELLEDIIKAIHINNVLKSKKYDELRVCDFEISKQSVMDISKELNIDLFKLLSETKAKGTDVDVGIPVQASCFYSHIFGNILTEESLFNLDKIYKFEQSLIDNISLIMSNK